jgi:phosphatidylglycerol---prolipoprotein diacylglyceryl transferase
MALTYPNINPVALSLGPVSIRWYSLAYLAGFFGGWAYARHLAKRYYNLSAELVDDFVIWLMMGVIVGGRVGYMLFYNLPYYVANPSHALKLWEGGMAFHGGLLGVAFGVIWFARKHKLPVLMMGDIAAVVTPIGLFFGRIANFINGELYGRVTTHWVGMVFPDAGALPRHPSQLYQAATEGLLLGVILAILVRLPWVRARHGFLFGVLLAVYGASRFVVEFAREPDAQIGLMAGFSRGQMLCVPMILIGLVLCLRRPKTVL